MEEKHLQSYEKKKLSKIHYLILYFFIFAFLGWILETFYSLYVLGHFTKRGFLYGPICPIYGYSAVIMLTILKKYKNNSIKLFLYSFIIFSAFEYAVSFLLDALFAAHWWDYTQDFFNLNGRISIFYSFAWGIIAILFINHLFPFIEKTVNLLLKKIPFIAQSAGINIISIILLIDTLFSYIRYIK